MSRRVFTTSIQQPQPQTQPQPLHPKTSEYSHPADGQGIFGNGIALTLSLFSSAVYAFASFTSLKAQSINTLEALNVQVDKPTTIELRVIALLILNYLPINRI